MLECGCEFYQKITGAVLSLNTIPSKCIVSARSVRTKTRIRGKADHNTMKSRIHIQINANRKPSQKAHAMQQSQTSNRQGRSVKCAFENVSNILCCGSCGKMVAGSSVDTQSSLETLVNTNAPSRVIPQRNPQMQIARNARNIEPEPTEAFATEVEEAKHKYTRAKRMGYKSNEDRSIGFSCVWRMCLALGLHMPSTCLLAWLVLVFTRHNMPGICGANAEHRPRCCQTHFRQILCFFTNSMRWHFFASKESQYLAWPPQAQEPGGFGPEALPTS